MANMNESSLILAADVIYQARKQRGQIERVSESFNIDGLEAAYAVAELNTKRRMSEGYQVVGKKVGLTSKAVQQQLGVDQPDFGILFNDMEFLDYDTIAYSQFIQPKIEAEVAFVIGKDLAPHHEPTWGEFLTTIEYALPALEIVDSVIRDWKITLVDTVADNASCGAYVLGQQPVRLGNLSLGELGMQLTKNGQVVSVGTGAACLGHPLRAAWWLAKTMAARGQGLKAGEIILSGALGPMVQIEAGETIQANLGALGSVTCRIV